MPMCCGRKKRYTDEFHEFDREDENDRKQSCWPKALKWTAIIILIIAVLLFLTVFVIFPIIFMESISLQRFVMFPNFDQPENPQYENYALYGAVGVKNMYVTVDDIYTSSSKLSLGVWLVVPEDTIEEAENDPNFDFIQELRRTKKPIIIYFHGNSGTRIYPYPTYQVLRKYFYVVAFDYRGYGDSTDALLSEAAVVSDSMQLYRYVEGLSKSPKIFVWGHSLGTALSTHTLKELRKQGTVPSGLILEAPFTTMREEIVYHPLGKIFAWLPWFEPTVLDPLERNKFHFKTTTNILGVDCPIMILHAEDDSVIPYFLGEKLYEIAKDNRQEKQGPVSYHQIPAKYRADHLEITSHSEVPQWIEEFLEVARNWHRGF